MKVHVLVTEETLRSLRNLAKYDVTLAKQLEASPKYANYTSSAAQNEIVHSIAEALNGNVKIKVFFANLEELYNLIEASPKRNEHSQRVQKELGFDTIRTLKRHALTRWESHSQVVKEVMETYPAIIAMLEDVVDVETEIVSGASGLLSFCKKFEFTLMTIIFKEILQTTNIINKALQASDIDLGKAFDLIDSSFETLSEMRNEQKLEEFLERARKVAVNARGKSDFQEKRPQKRKRQFDAVSSEETAKDPKQSFKTDVFYYALDMIKQQMVDRLSSHRDILRSFQCLMPERLLNQSPEENRRFDVVCFEQEDDFGGLWRFTTDDSHSSVCKSTVINTSKEMMSYSDFPAPKDFPVYMPNVKVMEYLHLYVKHFNISKYIKLDTVVKSVKKSDDHDLTGKWDITFFPHGKEIIGQKCETFDFIFVCTGHHWIKNLPHFDGIDDFKGKKIHAKQYKDFKGYEDKRVLVIGIGNSGGDISVELSRHAKQVFLSTRRGAWVIPRMAHGGYPLDQFKNRRIMSLIPKSVVEIVGQKIANERFDHKKFGLKPEHGITQQQPTVNDDLPSRISTGKLKIKPNVKLIKERSVVFDDNTEAADLDAIIFATGYKIGFLCLEEGLVPVERNQVPLYKYVFPDSHEHHTMAILGCLQPSGAIMPLSELQARWACKVFSGTKCLPSLDEMKADTERKRKAMSEQYYQADRHTIQVDYIDYADEIAREIGCKPNILKLLFKDPSLAFSCLFGPCVPYQYRLMGPDPWDGAKKAIEAAEENTIFPTRTRIVSKTNETGPKGTSQQNFEQGIVNKSRIISIDDVSSQSIILANKLGVNNKEYKRSLLGVYCFTECDTVSAFAGKGKLKGYARIILAFASFYYMPTSPYVAGFLYLMSGFLDALDGHAARALNQASKYGAVLDMLTDSSMMKGKLSHKSVEETANPFLKLYYTSRVVLFIMCAGNELFFAMLYMIHFEPGPTINIFSTRLGLWQLLAGICFPISFIKNLINLVQMIGAFQAIANSDVLERQKKK
eukprot:gene15437-6683_t